MSHDYVALTKQILRAVRQQRSQVAFSRRLGFTSNVAAQWESGRRIPRVLTAFAACERTGIDVRAALATFRPSTAHVLGDATTGITGEALAAWLDAQRGKEPVSALARRAALSRHQTARFLSAYCEPRLHEFFALVDATTGRLSDLVALLVNIDDVPALAAQHAQIVASRRLAFDEPWSSAVLSAVECVKHLKCAQVPDVLARAFGLDRRRIADCLEQMEHARVLQRVRGRYQLSGSLVVDTDAQPEGARRLRQHWSSVAAERLAAPGTGDVFSYNVFAVSREDLRLIGRLQREHFQRLRSIIAKSTSETVALLNLQLIEWNVED